MASPDLTGDFDIAVVGAGIVGLAVARELNRRHPRSSIVVLEREPEIGAHQTGHNSGVIHAGVYYSPGSHKARLCIEGARAMYEFLDRHSIPHRRCGKVIVASHASQLPALDELERRGRTNGVPGLRRLDACGLSELEPGCIGLGALHSPETGVADFGAVARALASEITKAGMTVARGAGVRAIETVARRKRLTHSRGQLSARFAVFCAGAWSDRLAVLDGAPADPRVIPFRGAYLRLRTGSSPLVRSLIYPVPDAGLPFLGVHLTRHVHGDVSLGPTALLSPALDAYSLGQVSAGDLRATLSWPGTWKMLRRWWRAGATEVHHALAPRALVREAARYVPGLESAEFEPWFAGIRAQAVGRDGTLVDDFVLHETERAIHVRNAPSPAATSSLAIARLIADRAESALSG